MAELMAGLGTDARRTVFRKLTELNYRTGYSHSGAPTRSTVSPNSMRSGCGRPKTFRSLSTGRSSRRAALVESTDSGYFIEELDNVLHVGTKDALRKLVRDARLMRTRLGGEFLYCAADAERSVTAVISPGSVRRAWCRRSLARGVPYAR